MEKQSLIKSYCVGLLGLVLLSSSNNAAISVPKPLHSLETTSSDPLATPTAISPALQNSDNTPNEDHNNMLPVILSILALAVSGGAISLAILKNKKINERIESDNEKYNNKLKLLEDKYNNLLTSQTISSPNQLRETNSRDFQTSGNPNIYLERKIDDLSVKISELEDKLEAPRSNSQSINYSKNTHLSKQFSSLDNNINPFSQTPNIFQYDITTQPLEELAYIELVNTYRDNPRLLEQKAIKVSEDKDSIARRHTDSSQKIVLKQTNNGNYWVIHDDVGINCWLIPKINLRINQYSYETTKALFECHGYQLEHYNKFKLIKPAKVILFSSDEQTWQINELGILEFTVED